jgi:hypothetical protein
MDCCGGDEQETMAMIRRSRGRQQWGAGSKCLKKFSTVRVAGIYTHVLSVAPSGMNRWHRDAKLCAVTANRWDRVGLIGSIEIENLDQSNAFGVTEFEWTSLTEM